MIHFRRAGHVSLVFEMAGSALGNVGVKGGRLAFEEIAVIRMADNATLRFDPLHWRVAAGAVMFQECVTL